jgi:predicted N-acetyltransferase YhbS
MEIRKAGPSDLNAISSLLGELGFPSSPNEISERLQRIPGAVLVAVVQEVVVGVITMNIMSVLHRPTPVGRLSALVVSEQERGRGIGCALVTAAEKVLHGTGCGLVEVTSNFRLEGAHAFYKRMGYEATSFRFRKALSDAQQGGQPDSHDFDTPAR